MHGLPNNLDLSFFVGKELIQACFGEHNLVLHFAGEISVGVTSEVGVGSPGGACETAEDFRLLAAPILALLGQSVVAARREGEGTLCLRFAGRVELTLFDDSDEYESYWIRHGEVLIVV